MSLFAGLVIAIWCLAWLRFFCGFTCTLFKLSLDFCVLLFAGCLGVCVVGVAAVGVGLMI